MRFVGWLVYWVLGTAVLYGLCGFTEDFDPIYKWSTLIRALFIIGTIGWGIFLAYWVNQDD
jgi:hypothetical protein